MFVTEGRVSEKFPLERDGSQGLGDPRTVDIGVKYLFPVREFLPYTYSPTVDHSIVLLFFLLTPISSTKRLFNLSLLRLIVTSFVPISVSFC